MNKILPGQVNRSPQTTLVPSRQRRDFAEKLHAKLQKESQGASARDATATASQAKNSESTSEEGEKSMMNAGATVRACESASADVSGRLGLGSVVRIPPEGMATPSIGLLSGTLMWSRVYPEHLIASGYLSMVDTQASGGNASFEQTTGAGLGADTVGSSMSATPSMIESGLDRHGERSNFLFDELHPSVISTGVASEAGSDPYVTSSAMETDAATPADHFWAERLVRLTHDSNGQSTVWLRDYRLQAGDVGPVVERLRWHGRQEGVPIDRVVINGREVWRTAVPKEEY